MLYALYQFYLFYFIALPTIFFHPSLRNSTWSSCTHLISSCWSAALHPKRLVSKLPENFMAAPLLSSECNLHINTYLIICRFICSALILSSLSGSHIENWHSILRNGLVNASYTKLQVEYENTKVYTFHSRDFNPQKYYVYIQTFESYLTPSWSFQ